MTKTFFVGLCTFGTIALASLAHAQVSGAKAKDPSLQAAIEARQKALDTRDAAGWAKYSADDFIQVTADGVINGPGERMKAIAANTNTPAAVVIDTVRMFGPDAAVTIQHNAGTKNQRTLFWVRQGGTWKAVTSIGGPYADK